MRRAVQVKLVVDVYAGGVEGIASFYHLGEGWSPMFPAALLQRIAFEKGHEHPVIYLRPDCTVEDRNGTLLLRWRRVGQKSQSGKEAFPNGYDLVIPKTMIRSYRRVGVL